MYCFKKRLIILVLLIFTFAMTSCSAPKLNALYETSAEVDFVIADIEEYSVYPFSIDATTYYVSTIGGELLVSDNPKNQDTHLFAGNNGYFVGVDLGEFDGWIKYIPYYSTLPESEEETLICAENCKGFIKVNNTKAYAFTGSFDKYGKIYELTNVDGKWSISLVEQFDHTVVDYHEVDGKIYVLTSKALYLLSSNEEVIMVFDASEHENVYLTSLVYANDKFFCGSVEGVFCIDPDTNNSIWYEAKY